MDNACKDCIHDKVCGCRTHEDEICDFFERKQSEVIEVVRCENCEYYITPDRGRSYCEMMSNTQEGEYFTPFADHYCSYGEKKRKGVGDI